MKLMHVQKRGREGGRGGQVDSGVMSYAGCPQTGRLGKQKPTQQ